MKNSPNWRIAALANIDTVKNPTLRRVLHEIADISEAELIELGWNGVIRDKLLARLVLPIQEDDSALEKCWGWSGGTVLYRGKVSEHRRGIICAQGTNNYIYRIAFSLYHRRRIESDDVIRHRCPGGPNPLCANCWHILIGTDADNVRDREEDGNNGAKLYPERILRGLDHPCSALTPSKIQKIRATYNMAEDKYGLISALAKHFGHGRETISKAISGFPDVPDDASAAIDLGLLKIYRPSERLGDLNGRATMPRSAMELFYGLYHRSINEAGRRELKRYCSQKYSVSEGHLQRMAKGKIRNDIAVTMRDRLADQSAMQITVGVLEELFRPYPKLGDQGA